MKKLIFVIALYGFMSFAYASGVQDESFGVEIIVCGNKEFKIQSLDFYALYELIDTHGNRFPNLIAPGIGSIDEWSCLSINKKKYIVFRGNYIIRGAKDIDRFAMYVFEVGAEEFIHKGDFFEYGKLLQNGDFCSAKIKYGYIDGIYKKALFKKFRFE